MGAGTLNGILEWPAVAIVSAEGVESSLGLATAEADLSFPLDRFFLS